MGLGKNIELILKERNITVIELAKRAKVSPNTLYSLISRDGDKIDVNLLYRICKELDIALSTLCNKSELEQIGLDYMVPDTIAAHFDGDEFSEDELEDIADYIEFVKARNKSTHLLNAAHQIKGATKEDIKHDEDIMDDDKEWE